MREENGDLRRISSQERGTERNVGRTLETVCAIPSQRPSGCASKPNFSLNNTPFGGYPAFGGINPILANMPLPNEHHNTVANKNDLRAVLDAGANWRKGDSAPTAAKVKDLAYLVISHNTPPPTTRETRNEQFLVI